MGIQLSQAGFPLRGHAQGKRRGRAGGAWEHYARVLSRFAAIAAGPESSGVASPGFGGSTASLPEPVGEAARPVALLVCGAPFETTVPIAPLMRVGADTRETWDWTVLRLIGHQGRPSAKVNISHSLARSLLDRTFLLSDPDVMFSRTENMQLGDPQKFLVGLVAWAFASQVMTSDAPGSRPYGRLPGEASGSLSQADFLAELASLCRKLGDRDFAVERFDLSSPDLYYFWSRDGAIYGAINLSSKSEVLALESPSGTHEGAGDGLSKTAVLPSRSLVLFGLEA